MTRLKLAGVAVVAVSLAACQQQAPKDSAGGSAQGSAGSSSGSGGKSAARTEARPAPAAAPTPAPIVLAEGTELPIVLETAVSSGKSSAGDPVVAKLASDVKHGERVLVPAGAEVRGKVVTAVPSGRVKGKAQLVVAFDRLVVKGESHAIEATRIDITAGSQKKRDAAIIGGGAAGGAIIGGIAKGGKGAGIGAILGGAAGTGAVLATKGKEVELAAGAQVTLRLTKSAALR